MTDAPSPEPTPPLDACHWCVEEGRRDWVHLRLCQECGRIGCCDSSPAKHATSHYVTSGHPVIRSYEPGEDWWWCYVDHAIAEVASSPPAPSRTGP